MRIVVTHAARRPLSWLISDVGQMRKSSEAFARLRELNEAAADLQRNGKAIPAVMLAYAAMDILGSLSRPNPKLDATGTDFQNWVDTFMLPGSNLSLTAVDLWAARCGFLHCLSPYSKLSRSGRAKEICYTITKKSASVAQAVAVRSQQRIIVVFVPDLLAAFYNGAQRFARRVEEDPAYKKLFEENAEHLFGVL